MDKTKQNAVTALTELANDPAAKSQAARIRGVMPYIESAMASGVSRQSVLDTLREELNITMGMKSFEKALQRIRRERKKQGVVTANADNLPALSGELVVYTDEPATGEVLEGASVKQEEWEDDELGDANKPREESDGERSTREAMEFVQKSLLKGSVESALSRTPEKPQIRIPGNT